MDVIEALSTRRMVRSFAPHPIAEEDVLELLTDALWAPTAGHSRGIRWIALVGASDLAAYFDAATDEAWREGAARAPGLLRAAAGAVCVADPARYVERYAESDKQTSGLGAGAASWPVPYWVGDAGAATMAALLLAQERGIAASFLGSFRRTAELGALVGLAPSEIIYGTLLFGAADEGDRRSSSLDRPGPSRAQRVQRLGTPPS
jgi:nitroreductase